MFKWGWNVSMPFISWHRVQEITYGQALGITTMIWVFGIIFGITSEQGKNYISQKSPPQS
jgi:hypothetical protein